MIKRCTIGGINMTYDKIAEAVRDFWKQSIPQPVVVYFCQKYNYEDCWEACAEIINCVSSDDYETVEFCNDFCEGQQCVKDIMVVPLIEVINYYKQNKL